MRAAALMEATSEDDEWIAQSLAGDREAFGCLVQKYKDSLFDMAYRMLRNRADAEDMLQEIFVAAFRHLSTFNHQSHFSTWLYSITLNRIRNQWRHNKVLRWSSIDQPYPMGDEEKPMEFPARELSVESLTEKKLELEEIEKEVQMLPISYQALFILHYFQGLSIEEVAERVNRPIGTVKVYLHRARKLLFKRLLLKHPASVARQPA